ncbi:MAG TPA: hypothetical protein VHW70_00230, partial [Edaphobacter sp.]|nr:hypothetical protein [Edaphobacter sp.]
MTAAIVLGFSASPRIAQAAQSNATIPSRGSWVVTGNLHTARDIHTATLLPNGLVLVAGGLDTRSVETATAELYDPATGK